MTPRASLLFLALAGTAGALTAEALASAPRYKMVLDAATPEHGVKTVSLVANPAIQRGWVALSASPGQKLYHLSTATAGPQKQVLTGPALLPGQEILRLDAAGNPFYITFDEATIEGTARQFAAQGRHNSTNQDHAVALEGNVVYESWIVRDPARDPAAVLGLDVPAGTWMLSIHIPDADYWQNEVVTGNKTGFSIEGLFDSQQLNLSAAASPDTDLAIAWLKAGIDLHTKHMDGTAPTTGAEGEASQATMMGQMQGALTALTGEAAAPMAMAATKKKPMPGMKMSAASLLGMNYFTKVFAKLAALGGDKAKEICLALGMEMLADGRQLSIDDNTMAVTVIGPDGVPGAALPDGEYDLMNGGKLVVAGGLRQDGEGQPADPNTPTLATDPPTPPTPAAAVPAPLAPTASMEDVVKTMNEILGLLKTDSKEDATEPVNPATAPAGQKMAAQLHGVEVVSLKLDAIELADGDKLTLNPVSKRLAHADGSLVESGYFAAADGSYFQVSTDQWFYQISKQTYDQVYGAKLQEVELAETKAKLAATPGGKVIKLHGEQGEASTQGLTRGQIRLARAEAKR